MTMTTITITAMIITMAMPIKTQAQSLTKNPDNPFPARPTLRTKNLPTGIINMPAGL